MQTKHCVLLYRKNHIKIIKQLVVMLLFSSVVAGCAGMKTIPLPDKSTTEFNGKSIMPVAGEHFGFIVTTATKAILLGPLFSGIFNAGDQIIEDNEISDPAVYISQKLTEDISAKYGLKIANRGESLAGEKVSALSDRYTDSDYVLDVRTTFSHLIYFLTGKYGVYYDAELRLINTKDKHVIAAGTCSFKPVKSDNSPSFKQFIANKASRLKEEFRTVANYCINEFKTNVLGI